MTKLLHIQSKYIYTYHMRMQSSLGTPFQRQPKSSARSLNDSIDRPNATSKLECANVDDEFILDAVRVIGCARSRFVQLVRLLLRHARQ